MVETIGIPGETNGYADAHAEFRQAHENNTRQLLNLAAGRKKTDPLPAFDPEHSDNHWPLMVHHAVKGELTIGKNLLGLKGRERVETEAANKKELEAVLKQGYRREPYPKPQVALLDPAVEKAALLERNKMLEGMIVQQNDLMLKLSARLEAIEKGQAEDPKK